MVPEAQFVQIQAALPELRTTIRKSEDAKAAFLRGLLRARDLENAPNKAPDPTPMSVTPAADAPVAPATGAAQL